MPIRIKPGSAFAVGVIIGLPAFLALGKAFVWIMSVVGAA